MNCLDIDALLDYFGEEYLSKLFQAAIDNEIYCEGELESDLSPVLRFLYALSVDLSGGTVETKDEMEQP